MLQKFKDKKKDQKMEKVPGFMVMDFGTINAQYTYKLFIHKEPIAFLHTGISVTVTSYWLVPIELSMGPKQ